MLDTAHHVHVCNAKADTNLSTANALPAKTCTALPASLVSKLVRCAHHIMGYLPVPVCSACSQHALTVMGTHPAAHFASKATILQKAPAINVKPLASNVPHLLSATHVLPVTTFCLEDASPSLLIAWVWTPMAPALYASTAIIFYRVSVLDALPHSLMYLFLYLDESMLKLLSYLLHITAIVKHIYTYFVIAAYCISKRFTFWLTFLFYSISILNNIKIRKNYKNIILSSMAYSLLVLV